MNNPKRYALLAVVVVAIGGSIWYLQKDATHVPTSAGKTVLAGNDSTSMQASEKTKQYPRAREIVDPTGFINSPNPNGQDKPFTIADYVGKKVILVDFWTYSCINCQRTFPYLTAWDAKYKDDGLLIVGIHTPEFEFEKVYDNVKKATEQFGIQYPVVLDSNYGTWNNYSNRYWPHHFLIDIDGYIVDDHIGEGGYEETEAKIQELLAERAERLGVEIDMDPKQTVQVYPAPTGAGPRTPEIYFGASRNQFWGNGTPGTVGATPGALPKLLLPNLFYLQGDWSVQPEFAQSQKAGDSITLRYSGANVYMVADADTAAAVQVRIDGKPVPASIRGSDVGADGTFMVHDSKLYNIINDTSGWGEHTLELIITKPGLRAFTFTFG